MAWTAPTTPYFSVAEVVTATKMNVLSDDLRYLKGMDGAVTIEDRVNIPLTSGSNGKGLRFGDGSSQYADLQSLDLGGNSYFFFATNRQYDGSAWQQLNTRAAGTLQITQDTITFQTFPAASSTPTERFRVNNNAYCGIGTASAAIQPQGILHAYGGNVTTAGFLVLSAAAVTSLQTLTSNGTVSRGAAFIILDRNNTGGTLFMTQFGIAISTSTTYVNTDTIQVAITAAGAITVQRTAGTNGTHDISMILILM